MAPKSQRSPSVRGVAWMAAGLCAIYLISCIATLRTGLPWCDEGWFADPAYNLITRGVMANSTLDPTFAFRTVHLAGIDRHTYWIMPLYVLAQAGWYELVGFGLFSMRSLSLLWSFAALAALFSILESLLRDRILSLTAVSFVALDFHFIWAATAGRMDMMSVALGLSGLAVYLRWRKARLWPAVFAAHCLIAAALFTHPYAMLFFIDLALLILQFDRKRLRLAPLLAGAVPYLVGLAAWAWYISRDPANFWSQFSGNAASRFDGLLLFKAPWKIFWDELKLRYLDYYGLAPYTHGFSRLKLMILAAYGFGFAATVATRRIRTKPAYRALILLAATHGVLLIFDGLKVFTYLLYTIPLLAILLAVWVVDCWRSRPAFRVPLAATAAIFMAVQCGTVWSRVAHNDYGRRYLPVTQFLRSHAGAAPVIMGSSELGFGLGFRANLVDDFRLGCRSGKRAGFVVIDQRGYGGAIDRLEHDDPACYRFIQDQLARSFQVVYDAGGYTVYQRRT